MCLVGWLVACLLACLFGRFVGCSVTCCLSPQESVLLGPRKTVLVWLLACLLPCLFVWEVRWLLSYMLFISQFLHFLFVLCGDGGDDGGG